MKRVVILRGVASSGKSTKAKQLTEQYFKLGHSVAVCSADSYFMVGETYYFNKDELGKAHAQCKRLAAEAIRNQINVVIIDNTNTRGKEARDYVLLARLAGYEIEILEIPFNHLSAETLAARNTHGVPIETIRSMMARYEPIEEFKHNAGVE